MASTPPTIKIKVGGKTVSVEVGETITKENGLFMLYMQAVKGSVRQQWIVFPPADESLGVRKDRIKDGDPLCILNRTQLHEGNRSKWQMTFDVKSKNIWKLPSSVDYHVDREWEFARPTVVPLEVDDYLELWNNRKTPAKAIRAIGRHLKPLGLTTN